LECGGDAGAGISFGITFVEERGGGGEWSPSLRRRKPMMMMMEADPRKGW
jgi:hypothetical protein